MKKKIASAVTTSAMSAHSVGTTKSAPALYPITINLAPTVQPPAPIGVPPPKECPPLPEEPPPNAPEEPPPIPDEVGKPLPPLENEAGNMVVQNDDEMKKLNYLQQQALTWQQTTQQYGSFQQQPYYYGNQYMGVYPHQPYPYGYQQPYAFSQQMYLGAQPGYPQPVTQPLHRFYPATNMAAYNPAAPSGVPQPVTYPRHPASVSTSYVTPSISGIPPSSSTHKQSPSSNLTLQQPTTPGQTIPQPSGIQYRQPSPSTVGHPAGPLATGQTTLASVSVSPITQSHAKLSVPTSSTVLTAQTLPANSARVSAVSVSSSSFNISSNQQISFQPSLTTNKIHQSTPIPHGQSSTTVSPGQYSTPLSQGQSTSVYPRNIANPEKSSFLPTSAAAHHAPTINFSSISSTQQRSLPDITSTSSQISGSVLNATTTASQQPASYSAEYTAVVVEEERFMKQYSDWKKQYQDWKEQNKNHPDQALFSQYETQWRSYEAEMEAQRKSITERKAKLEHSGDIPVAGKTNPSHTSNHVGQGLDSFQSNQNAQTSTLPSSHYTAKQGSVLDNTTKFANTQEPPQLEDTRGLFSGVNDKLQQTYGPETTWPRHQQGSNVNYRDRNPQALSQPRGNFDVYPQPRGNFDVHPQRHEAPTNHNAVPRQRHPTNFVRPPLRPDLGHNLSHREQNSTFLATQAGNNAQNRPQRFGDPTADWESQNRTLPYPPSHMNDAQPQELRQESTWDSESEHLEQREIGQGTFPSRDTPNQHQRFIHPPFHANVNPQLNPRQLPRPRFDLDTHQRPRFNNPPRPNPGDTDYRQAPSDDNSCSYNEPRFHLANSRHSLESEVPEPSESSAAPVYQSETATLLVTDNNQTSASENIPDHSNQPKNFLRENLQMMKARFSGSEQRQNIRPKHNGPWTDRPPFDIHRPHMADEDFSEDHTGSVDEQRWFDDEENNFSYDYNTSMSSFAEEYHPRDNSQAFDDSLDDFATDGQGVDWRLAANDDVPLSRDTRSLDAGMAKHGSGVGYRGRCMGEHSKDLNERGRGVGERGRGVGERGRGVADRGRGGAQCGRGVAERGRGGAERGRGWAQRGRGGAERVRGGDHRGRGVVERGRGVGDRSRGISDRGRGTNTFKRGVSEFPSTYDEPGRGWRGVPAESDSVPGSEEIDIGRSEFKRGRGVSGKGGTNFQSGLRGRGWGEFGQGRSEVNRGKGQFEQDRGEISLERTENPKGMFGRGGFGEGNADRSNVRLQDDDSSGIRISDDFSTTDPKFTHSFDDKDITHYRDTHTSHTPTNSGKLSQRPQSLMDIVIKPQLFSSENISSPSVTKPSHAIPSLMDCVVSPEFTESITNTTSLTLSCITSTISPTTPTLSSDTSTLPIPSSTHPTSLINQSLTISQDDLKRILETVKAVDGSRPAGQAPMPAGQAPMPAGEPPMPAGQTPMPAVNDSDCLTHQGEYPLTTAEPLSDNIYDYPDLPFDLETYIAPSEREGTADTVCTEFDIPEDCPWDIQEDVQNPTEASNESYGRYYNAYDDEEYHTVIARRERLLARALSSKHLTPLEVEQYDYSHNVDDEEVEEAEVIDYSHGGHDTDSGRQVDYEEDEYGEDVRIIASRDGEDEEPEHSLHMALNSQGLSSPQPSDYVDERLKMLDVLIRTQKVMATKADARSRPDRYPERPPPRPASRDDRDYPRSADFEPRLHRSAFDDDLPDDFHYDRGRRPLFRGYQDIGDGSEPYRHRNDRHLDHRHPDRMRNEGFNEHYRDPGKPSFPSDSSHHREERPRKHPKSSDREKSTGKNVNVTELFLKPMRNRRPRKILIILRGAPGAGKTYLAKLIRECEVENGGSAPRMLCLDDYFMVEVDKREKDPETGKMVDVKTMEYEYEAEMEATYRESLVKALKKTVDNGFFNFIIYDAVNDKLAHFTQIIHYAQKNGFFVYVTVVTADVATCVSRNIHKRSKEDIQKIVENWESTPGNVWKLDCRSILQDAAIPDVEMEDDLAETETKETTVPEEAEETKKDQGDTAKDADQSDAWVALSKWEMDTSHEKLDKLDGLRLSKRKRSPSPQNLEEYLKLDELDDAPAEPGKKKVRWVDIEERKRQVKRREVGFVVGQTAHDWHQMTDDSYADKALNRTKYI